MFNSDILDTPARSRAEHRRNQRQYRRRSAFHAACLTAGLVTAFACGNVTPAHANIASITTSTGLEVFDGSEFLAGGSSYGSNFITAQGTAVAGANGTAVVIFTQAPQIFIGQDFASFFNANESVIVNDITNSTYSGADFDNFISKIESLNLDHIDNGLPISAVVFSNGSNGGTIDGNTISSVFDGGWGLAAEPNGPGGVPEPGTLTTMLTGVLGVMGAAFAKMRRRRTN